MAVGDGRSTLAFAVLGSADSDVIVEAPDEHAKMGRLKTDAEQAGQDFYCSMTVGGCGGRLMVVNGPQRRPHFRHYAKTGCKLRDDAHVDDVRNLVGFDGRKVNGCG